MKVIIIDSGIGADSNIKCSNYSWVEGRFVLKNTECYTNKHGEEVARIFLWECSNVEVYSLTVLNPRNRGSFASLVSALEFSMILGADIIVMSLGYEKEDKKEIAILSGLCESIKETGTVIFAAHSNHHSKVAYPASFKSVIGIKYVEGLKKNVMIDFNNRNIILSTDCVCISKIGSNYVRKGNSYLCPFISGVYGSFLQQGLVKNIDNFLSKEKKEYLQKIYLCKDMILNNLIPRHKKLAYYTNKVDENNIKHFNYLSSKVNHILLITDVNKLNELETGSCVFIGQCNISLYEYYKLKELVTNTRYNKVNIVMMYPIFNAIERLQFMKEIDAIYSLYI